MTTTEPIITILFNRMRRVNYDAATYSDFCGLCSRVTDHFGEHDEYVELGLAAYEQRVTYYNCGDDTVHPHYDRSIEWTDAWWNLSSSTQEFVRRHLFEAYGEKITQELAGQVSLIKPIGEVLTRFPELKMA